MEFWAVIQAGRGRLEEDEVIVGGSVSRERLSGDPPGRRGTLLRGSM